MSGTNYTQTPNYGFYKPIPNADVDAWGDHWNANADNLDSLIHGIDTRPAGGVQTWNTRAGAVTLQQSDVTAVGFSTTAQANALYYGASNPAGYISQSAADGRYYASTNPSNYVSASGAAAAAPVQSVSGHTGAVSLIHSDITDWASSLAPYAPLASPTFTGAPSLPSGAIAVTQAPGDADTSIATTAFVAAAVSAGGFAPLASPVFTGDPRAPTATQGDNDTSIATTAFVTRAVSAIAAGATVSDTPPAGPNPGALWFDSAGLQMYVWEFDGNSSQWLPVVNQSGSLAPAVAANTGRNLVHNGTFAVQQRGAGPWTTNFGYTADRWQMTFTNDTLSVQVAATPVGGYAGDEAQRYYLYAAVTGSATAGSFSAVQQFIEGVSRLSGKTVTVSFYCGNSVAPLNIGVELTQYFGTGGSPSTNVVSATQVIVAGTTTWTRYSATFTLPSIVGKTLGTNNNDATLVRFWLSNVSNAVGRQTGNFAIWGVQLEIGSVATPLAKRDPADELALCQRFYQTGQAISGVLRQNAGDGFYVSQQLPVTMRATPTVTPTATGSQANISSFVGGAYNSTSVYLTGAATATAASTMAATYTASADL